VRVGLVGYQGSGKSTLFDTLTEGKVPAAVDLTSVRVATVTHHADERFNWLADLYQPKKRSPVAFELHDYPGLAPRDSKEPGFKPGIIRDEVQALVLVVRGFTTMEYFYPRPAADPGADVRDLVADLLLSDLEMANRRVEKLEISAKRPTPKQEEEKRALALMVRIRDGLMDEVPVKAMEFSRDEEKSIRGFGFLSQKHWFLLVSHGDDAAPDLDGVIGPIEDRLAAPVKLERELLDLDDEEREMFMEEMGVGELVLPGLLDRLLHGLGMLRFYTVGPTEVHVWELERGGNAVAAAGKIHSDLARGFIRAEVTAYSDLYYAGEMRKAKAMGHCRLEGRDYIVKDGDILDIRFSV